MDTEWSYLVKRRQGWLIARLLNRLNWDDELSSYIDLCPDFKAFSQVLETELINLEKLENEEDYLNSKYRRTNKYRYNKILAELQNRYQVRESKAWDRDVVELLLQEYVVGFIQQNASMTDDLLLACFMDIKDDFIPSLLSFLSQPVFIIAIFRSKFETHVKNCIQNRKDLKQRRSAILQKTKPVKKMPLSTEKRALITELKNYVLKRAKEARYQISEYQFTNLKLLLAQIKSSKKLNTFFSFFGAYDAQIKLSAAIKAMMLLEDADAHVEFTQDEIKALVKDDYHFSRLKGYMKEHSQLWCLESQITGNNERYFTLT